MSVWKGDDNHRKGIIPFFELLFEGYVWLCHLQLKESSPPKSQEANVKL